jgi:hypothetical protein
MGACMCGRAETRDRPLPDQCRMKALISPSLWGWIGQQFDSCYRAFQSRHSLRAHSKMGDGLAFSNDRSVNGCVNKRFKSDVCDSLIEPKIRGSFEINNRGNSAADCGQGNLGDWRRHCGFIWHDGVPWLWESSKECWLPVTESSRADEYADLQSRLAPKPQARRPYQTSPKPIR